MPLDLMMKEFQKVLEAETPTEQRDAPVIVMFANHVNVHCRDIRYHDAARREEKAATD